jgi:enoyl-CoA hydratase
MPYKTITYKKECSVGVVTINPAEKEEGQISCLADEFSELYGEITSDNELRAIIIAGFGEQPFSIMESSSKPTSNTKKMLSLTESLAKLDQPVIACIMGNAIGQRLEIALACDLRICSDSAHFAMNHITYGDIPWDGGTQRLSRLVGRAKAMEMIFTGDIIDAYEAHRTGLVHRVVPEVELLEKAMDMARELTTKSSISIRYAKEAINKGMDFTLEQGLRLEADLYFLLHTTKDRNEGIRAFQEKRTPRFEGK